MRLRINSKWHKEGKEVSLDERANTLAFIAWKVAAGLVLDLENEEFQTDTQAVRLDVIKEACGFLISVTDRLVAPQVSEDERRELITKMALKLVKTFQENGEDLLGKGQDYQTAFIALLNERMAIYAECTWNDEKAEPGFQYKRVFGDAVAAVMGAKDNKWIAQQIIELEVPMMLTNLKKGKAQMLDDDSGESEDIVRELRKQNRGED